MAAQIELSRDDYEYSIARIFCKKDNEDYIVGTGFLAAPGYVLTCAHVVLQAMGTQEEDFATADAPLGKMITLDFPVANGGKVEAEVVTWQPYQIDGGDIAGLKLLATAPHKSKPLPIIRCACEEIQDQCHAVYGFTNDNGDRTDAYKPKSNAPGGRFQLYKASDNPPDETIEAGFSGAPVWNDERKGVIGMVATAAQSSKDHRSKAYAIHGESLSPVIEELFTRSLSDSIHSHLGTARRVETAIETAFWLCDTEGDLAKRKDLLDRLRYVGALPNRNWQQNGQEIDRLTQWAMFLVVMDGLPEALVNEITTWVKLRKFDFEALYLEANRYRQKRQVASSEASPHLVVQIRRDEQDVGNVSVSIWVIDDRDRYDPLEPHPPRVQERVIAFSELPTFLETWLQEESNLDSPMIHCFVARHLLGCDLDACKTESELTLGSQYRLVMRTDIEQSPPPGGQYHARWKNKWQSFEAKQHSVAREAFVRSDCRDKRQLYRQLRSAEMAILENLPRDQVGEIFKFIADKIALPIALWVRQDEFCEDLDRLLDCTVINLPESVLEERLEAMDETYLGYHVSLVWEDPKVIPPTWVMPLIQ